MTTVRMSAQDALWLTMDRPNNLMVVDGVVVLAGTTTLADAQARFADAVERYPVLARRPAKVRGQWNWEDDPDFDLANHVVEGILPEPADVAALQRFLGVERSVPLASDRPLWIAYLVPSVVLEDGTEGAAVVTRFHHAIADGVRLTQVLLSLCEAVDGNRVPVVARKAVGTMNPLRAIGSATGEAARVSLAAGQAAVAAVGDLASGISGLNSAGAVASGVTSLPRAGLERVGEGIDLVRHPDRLLDVFEAFGGGDHRSMNDVTSVTKLVLTDSDSTLWTGTPGEDKDVSWSPPLSLPAVKAAAKRRGATVNDVLVSAVAGGLQRYLAERDLSVREVVWMVPVNLKPFEENLPEDLGNYFALVMLPMPLHHDAPDERLAEIHSRMQRIKNSDEAALTFGLQRTLSVAPGVVASALTNFFANKTIGILTNVPGPTGRMTFAGVDVRQVMGFAPCSGDQPLTATIFTYDGQVTVGFAGDRDLVPGLSGLVDHVVAELALLTETDD
jgi:diacylglycerol O-acyltransferase